MGRVARGRPGYPGIGRRGVCEAVGTSYSHLLNQYQRVVITHEPGQRPGVRGSELPVSESANITLLTTGGTIDKIYSLSGELEIGDPAAAEILNIVRPNVAVAIRPVLRKDSLDLTESDRQILLEDLRTVAGTHVVITHGTDTMTDTADYLRANGPDLADKVIVFTGAMQPAALKVTDSHFNLGAAFAAVQLLEPGIYIAMSGRIFPVGTVVKDRTRGQFVTV